MHYAQTPEQVQVLLDNGADINLQDLYGVTPLSEQISIAVSVPTEDGVAIIQKLLEAGADPWLKDNRGKIPLEVARERNDSGARAEMISWMTEKLFKSRGISRSEAEKNPGFKEAMEHIENRPQLASRAIFELTKATLRTAPPGVILPDLREDLGE